MKPLPLSSLVLLFASTAGAQDTVVANWPQFLGPEARAVSASQPATLGFDIEQDVLWRVPLSGGCSSPCIWGERLFLTAYEDDQFHMLAFDRGTGKELWRRSVPRMRASRSYVRRASTTNHQPR